MVDTQMELSPGYAVLGMVLDTLSGRTPLYRLTEFFEEKDTELLLGESIEPERFCDTNLGRSMDKVFETGAQKIFSQLAQNALTAFEVDPRRLHFDTTSVSVFGDYDLVAPPYDDQVCFRDGHYCRPEAAVNQTAEAVSTRVFAGFGRPHRCFHRSLNEKEKSLNRLTKGAECMV